ncbi:MAG: DUF104 domain-containing protein [Candidatus Hydrogenedentes bacterium]|nr:DUF104 domain-containing protein [Candidatus Hydrogenedentota bacterium]
MTVRGHIENGAIVVDDRVDLPEGARVRIEVVNETAPEGLHPEIRKVFGILRDVEDLDAERLDAIKAKHLK